MADGAVRLRIDEPTGAAGEPLTLHVRGSRAPAPLINDDGAVAIGSDLTLAGGRGSCWSGSAAAST